MLEQYGMNDLVEGRDFFVEEVTGKGRDEILRVGIIVKELFFKDAKGNLLAYMKFHIEEQNTDTVAYIIDTTSASGFKHFDDFGRNIYLANGYNPEAVVPGFGKVAFAYVLAYIKKNYPKVRVVPVAAYKENEDAVWDLIDRVKDSTSGLIHNLSGGSEMHMATIFLR